MRDKITFSLDDARQGVIKIRVDGVDDWHSIYVSTAEMPIGQAIELAIRAHHFSKAQRQVDEWRGLIDLR